MDMFDDFDDFDWPLTATREFVSITWAFVGARVGMVRLG